MGAFGFLNDDDRRAFKDLLWIDAVRGQDNTGAASVLYDKPEEYNLCKVVGATHELMDKKSFDSVVQSGVSFLMGHNRSKTMGNTHPKNAHPFVFNNIIGAHNGTLTWASKGRMKDDTKFETDSEALFNDINEFGVDETIKKMDGAWALTWYNRTEKTINFLRNKERPLFYVMDDSNSTVYWASEAGMLYLILNRHEIKFNGKVKAVPENTWVKWQLNDKTGIQLSKPTHRTLVQPPFVSQVTHHHNSHYGYCGPINGQTQEQARIERIFGRRNGSSSNNSSQTNFPLKGEVIVLNDNQLKAANLRTKGKMDLDLFQKPSKDNHGFYKLWDGSYAFRDRFEKLMVDGCVQCSDHPVWTEPVKFLKDNSFICTICMMEPDHKKHIVDLIESMV